MKNPGLLLLSLALTFFTLLGATASQAGVGVSDGEGLWVPVCACAPGIDMMHSLPRDVEPRAKLLMGAYPNKAQCEQSEEANCSVECTRWRRYLDTIERHLVNASQVQALSATRMVDLYTASKVTCFQAPVDIEHLKSAITALPPLPTSPMYQALPFMTAPVDQIPATSTARDAQAAIYRDQMKRFLAYYQGQVAAPLSPAAKVVLMFGAVSGGYALLAAAPIVAANATATVALPNFLPAISSASLLFAVYPSNTPGLKDVTAQPRAVQIPEVIKQVGQPEAIFSNSTAKIE